jgi:F-type H+-transporting ATPase subunit delta
MVASIQAKTMAKGLFDLALANQDPVKWLGELRRVADLAQDAALAKLLQNPAVAFSEKAKVLSERAGGLDKEMVNTVRLLVEKGELGALGDVMLEYQRLLDAYHGVQGAETAEVATPIPLDEQEKLALGERLTAIIGHPVVIKATVDPSLLGGIKIKVGDKLIDGSIRHKLDLISKELV